MGFSGIGIWEIVIIFVVIIIILGPHRLPEIARTLGRAFRAIKKASSDLSLNITREIEETKSHSPSPPGKTIATKPTPAPLNKPNSPDQDDPTTKAEGHQPKNE